MNGNSIKPTSAELEILQILWKHQPCTVRFVHEMHEGKKDVGYTTTLKIMQNMSAKNMVRRELKGRSHVYYALLKKEETQVMLLDRFLDTAFSGSASHLVLQVLGNHKASKEELEQIKNLINKLEGEK